MLELIYPYDLAPLVPAPTADTISSSKVVCEYFPVVEPNGLVVGRSSRQYCHSGQKPLHPVVHLHIIDRFSRLYLQKRSMRKEIQPGKPGLASSKYHERAKKYLPKGGCGVVSFGLKGGREAASTFMKNLKLGAIETHVADARTCCLNPATSTHRQLTDEQLIEAGVPAELIRISLGIEDKEDLIADIANALDSIE